MNCGNLRSQLAEDAAATDLTHAVCVGVAHVALHALVLRVAVGAHVALEEGDASDGRITHRVAFAQGASGQGAVREGGLQCVEQIHHDLYEL